MKKRRIISAALAMIMALSSLSVLSSCNKTGTEPVKEKRTNVYSSTDLKLPENIDYINRLYYANGTAYFTYYKEYTITHNELGEEVERREGYYYQSGSGVYEDFEVMPAVDIPVEEFIEEVEVEIDDINGVAIVDAVADATVEVQTNKVAPALTGAVVTEVVSEVNGDVEGDVLPDGWWFSYSSVQILCCLSIDTGEITEIPLDIESKGDGYLNNFSITKNGEITATTSSWEYDEELGESSSKYYFLIIDASTGDIFDVYLNDIITEAGLDVNNVYVNNVVVASDGNYYMSLESTIIILDSDFKYTGQIEVEARWINNIMSIGDKIYLTYYSDGYKVKYIENGQLFDVESEILKDIFDNYYGIIGSDSEKVYYQMNSGVYAYDIATDTTAEILNYINSDIDNSNSSYMLVMDDGRILFASTDWEAEGGRSTTLQVLEKVPDELLSEEIIVKIGCTSSDYNLTRAIIRYNKRNTGVRIAVISYDQYNNEENQWTGAVQQLNNDIIMGKVPDMIYLNTSLPVESYFQKGIFTDLNKFIDDPEIGINRNDYYTNIFDANSVDGKLYSMILGFSINTLVAKTNHVGKEPGWTFEEMMACINSMPEEMTAFMDWDRDDIVNNLFDVSLNSFVDWETGTTQFQSQGFIDLIKYISTCSEKSYWDAYYDSMGPDYIYDEELEREFSEKYSLRFYKDYALFNSVYISSFTEMLYQMNEFATSDIIAIGYPTNNENENGSVIVPRMEFAISATSNAKNQAWDILKYFLTEDEGISYGFSIKRSVNEERSATASDNYYYSENQDQDFSWARDYGYSEDYINYLKESNRPFDQAGVDMVLDIIEGAGQISRTDSSLLEIIKEELSTFFAGTRSAEETARIIASRASIYIAENS